MRDITEEESDWLNADWIKVAGWYRTFTKQETQAFEEFKCFSLSMCGLAWLLQRQYRLSDGRLGVRVATDPDLHETLRLMRATGIPCDRMLPGDEWESRCQMKKPAP